jgi:hypothetical protein
MELSNRTPFAAARVVLQDPDGRDLLVVIVKATFGVQDLQPCVIADEQVPVRFVDEYYGEPDESSVQYESDLAPLKLNTDVVMLGHAYSQGGRGRQVDVTLRVGSRGKTCRVIGDRFWRRTFGRTRPSSPEPFERIPLVYERSFGGEDMTPEKDAYREEERRNYRGCGLVAKRSKKKLSDVALPNIEDPAFPVQRRRDRPCPAGFGFISRHWEPRRRLAGTYDARWERERMPILPLDFDPRYHNAAHPDLVMPGHLQGREPVEVINASPNGVLRFELPNICPRIECYTVGHERIDVEARFDTLIVEPDVERIQLVWRGSFAMVKADV